MAVRTAYDPTAGEVLTAANLERLPGGWIGYAEATANQTGVTTEVDVTGLSVTVTVGTNRRIRISGSLFISSTVTGDEVNVKIKETTTILQQRNITAAVATFSQGLDIDVVLTPSSGSHTYRLTFVRSAGTGTVSNAAASNNPSFILVEDIGPSS